MKKNIKFLSTIICLSLLTTATYAYADDLPSYYDWRLTTPTDEFSSFTNAIVGPVLLQSPYEDCWSFSHTASLESTLNIKLQAANLPAISRLSQRYLAWLSYAPTLDGSGDGFYFYDEGIEKSGFNNQTVFNVGGSSDEAVSVFVRYGAAYNDEYPYQNNDDMQGVSLVAGRGVALHDSYGLSMYSPESSCTPFINLNSAIRDYYKKLIQDYGVLAISYYANQDSATIETVEEQDILTSTKAISNHSVSLVGWDDDYTMLDKKGVVHTGAWIMRNSWGATAGDNGYFYLSYDDATAFAEGVNNAETDWGRYTAVNTIAPSGFSLQSTPIMDKKVPDILIQKGSYKIANKLTAGDSQMLKAVGIFAPADSMSYKVEVSLKGTTPTDTQVIYTKTGTFGSDGTSSYKGYRTIDFDKYVYLPNAQNYFITVTLTGKDGEDYYIPISYDQNQKSAAGVSYLYNPSTQQWLDTTFITIDGETSEIAMPMFALNKYSKEANGGDFTVASLNDNGVGGSEIYLGKKNELYTTDLLHPVVLNVDGTYSATGTPRYTLSNMTVDLTKGFTDSVYGGKISGEGQVIKIGTGMLALTGTNTYTGATNVKEGSFALTGSLQSPVTVANGAAFTGTGTINGNLVNKGTLQPGLTAEAQNLLKAAAGDSSTTSVTQVGELTVNGNFTSTGKVQISVLGTDNSKLNVKGTSTLTGSALSLAGSAALPLVNYNYKYLTSQGGIIGNVTPETISPYLTLQATVDGNNGYFTAANTTKLGNQQGTTPSENSVGSALNNQALRASAADPTSANAQALNALFYQDSATAGKFIKDVTSEARAELFSQSPMSSLTKESISSRMDTVDFSGPVAVNAAQSLDADAPQMKTSLPVSLDATNNVWFKLFRGFENYNYNDSLENKTFGGAVGYDHALNLNTRIGGLFSYGVTDYNTNNIEGKSYDWRVGVYGDHKNGDWDYQALATYGRNHYDLDRSVSYEGTKTNSDYKAKVWDGEVKARYFIPSTQTKTWQVKPYGKVSYTHTNQDAYVETGTSIFKQSLNSASNNSWRGEVGVELNRNLNNKTSWGGSVGYKRVISGLNPELNGTFVGDTNSFSIKSDNDRNYVTYSLNTRGSLGGKWMGQAEFRGEASHNTHKEVLSVTAKYSF